MSDKDDPFGLSNDAGRTRIRPVKSDRPATPPPAPAYGGYASPPPSYGGGSSGSSGNRPTSQSARGPRVRHSRAHPNPLIAAFSALLEIAPELERAAPPPSAETLRVRLQDTLIDARDGAVGMGVPLTRANQAAWFVAALLDDIALNTPWGGHSDWPRQPLVVGLSGDVDAGTKFFDRLDELMRFANRDPELLELGYICVSLGFRGKYRLQAAAGDGALIALRTACARLLRNTDAETADLSPHWRGVIAADEPPRFAVPLWTIALGTAALVTAIYIGLSIQLSGKGEQLYALARLVPPPERAEIFRPIRDTTVAAVPELVITPIQLELLPVFATAAPPDTAAALQGREDVSLAILTLRGIDPEVFRSSKADINEVYAPLVAAVAAVIVDNLEVIGKITVIGHTDSIPVQRSNPFASNQGLSEARAKTIADLLIAAGVPADKIATEGRGDAEPVGDNGTKAGRAENRRVEIKIEKRL